MVASSPVRAELLVHASEGPAFQESRFARHAVCTAATTIACAVAAAAELVISLMYMLCYVLLVTRMSRCRAA